MHLRRELILFGAIGTTAFLVDASILYSVKGIFGVYWGRLLSFFCAVLFTWLLNRNLTFKHRASGKSFPSEFAHYFLVMLGGGAVNYILYAILVASVEAVAKQPILGVAAGSAGGFLFNFVCAKFFIFRLDEPWSEGRATSLVSISADKSNERV